MVDGRLESNGRPHRGHGDVGRFFVVLTLRRLRKAMVINRNRFIHVPRLCLPQASVKRTDVSIENTQPDSEMLE